MPGAPATAASVLAGLHALADPARAKASAWFFQARPGGYGEGDRFLGVRVPQQRRVARQFQDLPLRELSRLVASPWHEARLTALLIAVAQHRRAVRRDPPAAKALSRWFVAHLDHVDNWDLVDTAAPELLGTHVGSLAPLRRLAASRNVWRRRVAMLAAGRLVRDGRVEGTLEVAGWLVQDGHDLVQKAVGWMLREAHAVEPQAVEAFLDEHAATMPRTMLRYALERMPAARRASYMQAAGKA